MHYFLPDSPEILKYTHPRYPGQPDLTNFVQNDEVSGTTGQSSMQGNLELITSS